jgi:hypothetical protein
MSKEEIYLFASAQQKAINLKIHLCLRFRFAEARPYEEDRLFLLLLSEVKPNED